MMKKLSLILLALLLSVQLAAFADGEITGEVYGNGSVTVETGEDGVTFTFAPGAANELKSFTVDGAAVDVADNKATVSSANTYEAVFEGKAQSVTRETQKLLMENGVVAENGLSAADSKNNIKMTRAEGSGTLPAFGAAGYELSRSGNANERMDIQRISGYEGLAKTAIGRTYQPIIYYTNTHSTWNINVWFYQVQIYTGYLNNTSERVFINGCNSSWIVSQPQITTTNTVKSSTVGREVPGSFEVSSINDDKSNPITEKSAYVSLERARFINPGIGGYGDGHVYVSGISFKETSPYHAVTADIGAGEMTFSSDSLNFGKDNDNVKVKNGVALAVEDNRTANFTVTAPSGKTVKEVKFGDTVLTAEDGVYTIPYVSADGAITVLYEDEKAEIPAEYSKKFDFASYVETPETQVGTLTPYSNGTVTFEFYDNGVTGGLVAFKDDKEFLREYLKLYADGNYCFTALDATAKLNGEEVKIKRTPGAHKVEIKVFGDSYDVYLDSNLVHSLTLKKGKTAGISKIYVQNKSTKVTEGTSRELYYKPITAAEIKPSVVSTSVIENSAYNDGQTSAVIYAKVEGSVEGAGIILKDSAGHALSLKAYNADGKELTGGAFGIRVFGAAMVEGNSYKYVPYFTYGGDTEYADESTFVFGKSGE